jgi:hypothetical protein
MDHSDKLAEAKKRVKKKRDFYEHLTTYLVISVFLVVLNYITSPGNWWFQWPVLGWGMAVLFNYLDVFGVPGVGPMNKEWESKALREELDRIEREQQGMPKSKPKDEKLDLPPLEKERRPADWDDQELV